MQFVNHILHYMLSVSYKIKTESIINHYYRWLDALSNYLQMEHGHDNFLLFQGWLLNVTFYRNKFEHKNQYEKNDQLS